MYYMIVNLSYDTGTIITYRTALVCEHTIKLVSETSLLFGKSFHFYSYFCICNLIKLLSENKLIICALEIYIIRFQEKNLNLYWDSNLGLPVLSPGALPIELSWFSPQTMLKPSSWKHGCHLARCCGVWHYLRSVNHKRTNFTFLTWIWYSNQLIYSRGGFDHELAVEPG